MKFTFKLTLLFILLLTVSILGYSQEKPFEGVIDYEITFPGNTFPPEAMAMLPKSMKMYFSDSFSKTEMLMSMGNQSVIIDYQNLKTTALINVMGQKYAIVQTRDEIVKETGDNQIPTVEITDETKDIAGYTCKKALVLIKNKEGKETDKLTVFFTDKITVKDLYFHQPLFNAIPGLMLEYDMEAQEGLRMKLTALTVEKKKVSKNEFQVPADFKVTTKDELMKMFGGAGE